MVSVLDSYLCGARSNLGYGFKNSNDDITVNLLDSADWVCIDVIRKYVVRYAKFEIKVYVTVKRQ